LKFVELFAGIGGFSLGFERAGMECVGHVEINEYAQKILLKHWPDVPLLPDVTKVKGDEFGEVDLLCGGFPCQDLSVAGKQGGIHGERSGLYDEIIRIAGVCRPRYIVLENVANLIARTDWFGYVIGRLAQIGYDAEWEIIRASDVGAPHRRARVWIVAYPNSESQPNEPVNVEKGSGELAISNSDNSTRSTEQRFKLNRSKESSRDSKDKLEAGDDVADTNKIGLQGVGANSHSEGWEKQNERPAGLRNRTRSQRENWWEIEPNVGRVANGVPKRVDRLKCLGNALVPQIAEYIGNRIMAAEK